MTPCKECNYWKKSEKDMYTGECRFNPPQILTVPAQVDTQGKLAITIQGFFPQTGPDIWCGQGKPSENGDK